MQFVYTVLYAFNELTPTVDPFHFLLNCRDKGDLSNHIFQYLQETGFVPNSEQVDTNLVKRTSRHHV